MCDSQFIIEYLAKTYDKDLSKNLSDKEKAIERAFLKMTEESLNWFVFQKKFQNHELIILIRLKWHKKRCMVLERFVYKPSTQDSGISKLFLFIGGRTIAKRSKAQGEF